MTPTPDPPPAAPLTAEEIAAFLVTNNTTEARALIASHAALRDRLARAEERCEVLEGSMKAIIGYEDWPRSDDAKRQMMISRARVALATPTDGAARAGDAAGGESDG